MEQLAQSMGSGVMIGLLCIGLYFTLKLGIFQLFGIPFIWRNTVGTLFKRDVNDKSKGISPFQAMTTALAGTMGVGNIAGVATALVAGGPGAIFWMWVSAFFGMATKYAEIFLAVKYREKNADGSYVGGPMYYMKRCKMGSVLSAAFCLLCVVCSLGVGNLTQTHSASSMLGSAFSIPEMISGAVIALLVGMVILGGIRRISTLTEMIIPFISIAYIFGAAAFLYINRSGIAPAFALIFKAAFGMRQAAGGVMGYAMSSAVRFGLSRGVFTNEAGLGSAPIAHAAADCKSPQHQAVWGVFEVFLDTIVVCTITALVLLCAQGGQLWHSGLDGSLLTAAAFESAFGPLGVKFLAISVTLFALTAMLGWYYYGERSVAFLFGERKALKRVYALLFVAFVFIGSCVELGTVWTVADVLNAAMIFPNAIALLLLRNEVVRPDRGMAVPDGLRTGRRPKPDQRNRVPLESR